MLPKKNRRPVPDRALPDGLFLIQALIKERGREAHNRAAYLIGRKACLLKVTQGEGADPCSVTTVADAEVEHQVIPAYPIKFTAVSRTCPDADDALPWACDVPPRIPPVIDAALVHNQPRSCVKDRLCLGTELASGYLHESKNANDYHKPSDGLSSRVGRHSRRDTVRSDHEQPEDGEQ